MFNIGIYTVLLIRHIGLILFQNCSDKVSGPTEGTDYILKILSFDISIGIVISERKLWSDGKDML